MYGSAYTPDEDQRIRAAVLNNMTYEEIAGLLPGRSASGVANYIRRIGLVAKRKLPEPKASSIRDYLRRIERENERDCTNSNVDQDEAFQVAMKKAIAAGLEYVEEGVSLTPCTDNPKLVRPPTPIFMRSAALICFEHGDNSRDIFA